MGISDLSSTLALLLAVSLATERLVAVVKTVLPEWFADEKKTDAKEVDLRADRWRRVRVQAVAFGGAWMTASLLAGDQNRTPLLEPWALVTAGTIQIPAPIVALLASGGSAFWAQLVGYAGAVKDIAVTQKAAMSLEFQAQAQEMGVTPMDSGRVAGRTGAEVPHKQSELLQRLRADAPVIAGPSTREGHTP